MLIRFHTYEEACLFVATKRADGYFAEVIHQNAGHFYGSLAVNGFAVILSEEAAAEGDVIPGILPTPSSELAKMVAMLGLLGMVAGLLVSVFTVGIIVLHTVTTWLVQPVKIQIMMLMSCIALAMVFLGLLKITRIYRKPEDPLHGLAQGIMKTIAWFLIII